MSEQTKDEHAPEENATNGQAPEAANTQDGDYEALVRLMKENEELKDKVLRAAAEMENLRRRTAREIHDARNYSVANFARDMLTVSDNLQRALEAVPEEAKAADPGLAALAEGVEMTERSMLSALERHGVKKLDPAGEKFDPHFHQAMFEVPNPDVPANTVVQVVQAGYSIGERVLRPAMVGVSKGGPKNGGSDATAEAEQSGQSEG
ncbi:nucleotide exchange factor GrpE [Pseudaminobacter sp. 19-2017]|uniref:Protein GrpE n=1 Tax=Pseudaminobacter soli (ex Zhang et al. 2022) TaxID=2831468 RepID=A0A942DYW2_9HYPH|nr:nucleotide exchange factor GrpE [Pseudaminobacter soli]MBS3650161.1 nucleotide exchange factor GrpE [Pseudaminobacter soli]